MARIEKTVFISYRRTDVYTALAVYENLKNQGYDVFLDYRSIPSGDFEQIITSNIKARAHFLLILTPTALDHCSVPGDWLRREIETAIDEKRNIVPLFFKGFRFGIPSVSEKLTGKLRNLSRYNGLNVHEDYFDEAMQRVCAQFLNIPLDTVLHPVSTEVQKVVREEQVAADQALEQIEDVKELVRQAEEKPAQKKELPKPHAAHAVKNETASSVSAVPLQTVTGLAGGLLLIVLLIWAGANLLRNQSLASLEHTATNTAPPVGTPAQTSIPLTRTHTSTSTFSIIPTGTGAILATTAVNSTASCYGLAFVSDVTIPDNIPMTAGQTFTKTWKVKNAGSCAWDAGFKFVHTGGESMGGATYILSSSVAAGEVFAISIPMTVPNKTGALRGNWRMSTPAGQFFGDEVYVQIVVRAPTSNAGISSLCTLGSELTSDKDNMKLVCVPAGEFTMGSDIGDNDERPAHSVRLDAFWIDQTEVANKMYSICVDEGVCQEPAQVSSNIHSNYYGNPDYDSYPVIYVDWNMAKVYCEWAGRRLPSEAEWEKAARGENALIYPWGNDFDGMRLNFCDENCSLNWKDQSINDGYMDTSPVGNYPNGASPYGALDMAGNVWEWVNNWYEVYPNGDPNASLDFGNMNRVLRGGAADYNDSNVRTSNRVPSVPNATEYYIGFRCAMDAP